VPLSAFGDKRLAHNCSRSSLSSLGLVASSEVTLEKVFFASGDCCFGQQSNMESAGASLLRSRSSCSCLLSICPIIRDRPSHKCCTPASTCAHGRAYSIIISASSWRNSGAKRLDQLKIRAPSPASDCDNAQTCCRRTAHFGHCVEVSWSEPPRGVEALEPCKDAIVVFLAGMPVKCQLSADRVAALYGAAHRRLWEDVHDAVSPIAVRCTPLRTLS